MDQVAETENNIEETWLFITSATDLVRESFLSGRIAGFDTGISLIRDGIAQLPVRHPHRLFASDYLGCALLVRFVNSGKHEDINEAISLHRDTLELRSEFHLDRSCSLSYLAHAHIVQFHILKRSEALDEAIALLRDLLVLRPGPHPDRYTSLTELAGTLFTRFEYSGQQEDLDEAILLHRNALELQSALHSDRSSSLENLANSLIARFNSLQQSEDLDGAIVLQREALGLRPAPHPDRSSSLGDLAETLFTRFKHSDRRDDIDEVISLYREALELLPAAHLHWCRFISGLAIALRVRFEQQSGRYEDMEEAILLHRHALELLPAHNLERHVYLYDIASALATRFTQLRKPEDLEEAISLHRNALELVPASHPQRFTYLEGLADALCTRFDLSAQLEDSEESITLCREALRLLPQATPHRLRAQCLNGLATMLCSRGRQSNDLDEGIQLLQDALNLVSEPLPRAMYLHNLALALRTRFIKLNQPTDLELAINSCDMSLNTLSSRHPFVCPVLAALGNILMTAYSKTHELEYLDKSMKAFQDAVACESASTCERFHFAWLWAAEADNSRHASALDAYRAAIEFLPRLAMFGLDLQSRQQALSFSNGLACDAAACAIRLGQYEQAIELLEEGRAVFWSQAPRLHTSMTDLNEIAPELGKRLTHISFELERSSLPHMHMSRNGAFNTQQIITMMREAFRCHHLSDQWLATLEEVRQLDGFHDFLRPKRLSMLQDAAAHSPVIILNASENDCSALILTSTGVQHVPLHLNFPTVVLLVKFVRDTIEQERRYDSLPESNRTNVDLDQQMLVFSDTLDLERHMARVSDTSMQHDFGLIVALAMLFLRVARPIIHELNLEKSDNPPRLHWCPMGPFTFLPIHAAGMYHYEWKKESISEYAVSSYTPTISALLRPRTLPISPFKMMAVIQPYTPGQSLLPNTLNELRKIEAHVPNKDLIRLVHGTVEEVVSHLPKASIAHFACHGQQNMQNPFDSGLLLQDGQLKISQIMQQSMPNASLAFLSACETAMGYENLPDESIHLGAALLFAGFHGVVATMWSISDLDGPKIAEAFYENMFMESNYTSTNASGPDTTQAARALHMAVAKLRAENVPLARWVPFIHLGK